MKKLNMAMVLVAAAIAMLGFAQTATAVGKIDIMTMNQYLGADLDPIVEAEDPIEFNEAVVAVLEEAAANDFPSRAVALAEIITDRLPDLVGLQEAFIFTCTDLEPPTQDEGCDNPRIRNAFNDHLQLTLDAIAAKDEDYFAVATVVNFNTLGVVVPPVPVPGIPFVIDDHQALANIVDHDVILARGDIADGAEVVDYTAFQSFGICLTESADGCNYQVVGTATLPDGSVLSIERGFVGVDITVDGTDYRFVDTHLEVQEPDGTELSAIIQAAQAQELIYTLGATTPLDKSLIVVGDINSSPDDPIIIVPEPLPPGFPPVIVPPYTQLVEAGYTDAWTLRPGNKPGYSCCQLKDLSNHQSVLDERVDVIFSVDVPNRVKKARVLGARVSDKTPPPGQGLWPSDHGSVAADLRF
jgi:hypothetical protein